MKSRNQKNGFVKNEAPPRLFLKPNIGTYCSLLTLKKSGVKQVVVEFEGYGNWGSYSQLKVQDKELQTRLETLQRELQDVQVFLVENLDQRGDFHFTGGGCRGYIGIDLSGYPCQIYFSVSPAGADTSYDWDDLYPEVCLHGLLAEQILESGIDTWNAINS